MERLKMQRPVRLKCKRCDHKWYPRKVNEKGKLEIPRVCPKCHSPYWNKERRIVKQAYLDY